MTGIFSHLSLQPLCPLSIELLSFSSRAGLFDVAFAAQWPNFLANWAGIFCASVWKSRQVMQKEKGIQKTFVLSPPWDWIWLPGNVAVYPFRPLINLDNHREKWWINCDDQLHFWLDKRRPEASVWINLSNKMFARDLEHNEGRILSIWYFTIVDSGRAGHRRTQVVGFTPITLVRFSPKLQTWRRFRSFVNIG